MSHHMFVLHNLLPVPVDIQRRMVGPLTTLHADLTYLLAGVHPDADDFDIG